MNHSHPSAPEVLGQQEGTRQVLAGGALAGASPPAPAHKPLPDVANDARPEIPGQLERVGMSGIELVLRLAGPDQVPFLIPALADAYVSLEDDRVKGIHMSRLFLELTSALEAETFSPQLLRQICDRFLQSHAEISRQTEVQIAYKHPSWRPALLSDYSGPRHYPVVLKMVQDRRGDAADESAVKLFMQVQVVYSSTCPCSAALSRQLLERKFQQDFAFHRWVSLSSVSHWLHQNGSVATPHSQRSVATVDVELANPLELRRFPIERLIERIETVLQTAVQTVVKRQDEQEFARLNGANQMFCEDAARRMKSSLIDMPEWADFRIEARHMESLHPHDAVAIATRGVPGGLQA
jgi:GTP cyclohydrolase I